MVEHADRGEPVTGSRFFREYCAGCDEPIRVSKDCVGKQVFCDDCESLDELGQAKPLRPKVVHADDEEFRELRKLDGVQP